ncbi:MAG TPA: SDR family NAD(P)-dependent oxidoreductase, partial [Clostridia bacterium]|nr:SDR family NAD(P)-dependent oxidoreductase [Clostridia bacterium]
QIVPSLHSKEPNPNIDFANTPFVVQQELGEWKRPVVEKNGIAAECPRIAGISSFGAGGANAHLIIEEYTANRMEQKETGLTDSSPAIILLSARTDDRLKARVKQLLTAIEYLKQSGISLADVAYTLQLGREDMEKRMAVIVKSYEELKEKLKGFLEDCEDIEELYQGQLKNSGEPLAELSRDEDLQGMTDMWISKGKYTKLSEFWVKGLKIDWSKLYSGVKPRRVSLPAYQFAGERYWLLRAEAVSAGSTDIIHPLLHRNTSDLSEQRFSSNFTGEESFFTDHVVKGKKVLPGAAYFEMAVKALEQAAGIRAEGGEGVRIKNMAWTNPVVAGDDRTTVHIGLFPGDNGEIAFEVYSFKEENEGEALIHSEGSAVPIEIKQDMLLDIKALQGECSIRSFSASECYEAFNKAGIEYGPEHRGIEEIYLGEGKILAKLSLPVSAANTFDRYVLHPGMIDSALQASIAFALDSGIVKPALPFALKELDVLKRCSPNMWALLKPSDDNIPGSNKLDIDLCDEQGIVCVRMKGFTSRVIKEGISLPGENRSILLDACWKDKNVILENKLFSYTNHIVVLCELDKIPEEGIKAGLGGARCIKLKYEQAGIEERFQNHALKVFEEVQGILKDKSKGKTLIQVLIPSEGEQQLFSGIYGLLKTAQLENPKIIGQIIETDREEGLEKTVRILKENSQNPMDSRVRYQSGIRYVAGWNEVELLDREPGIPWKDRGVYLITGGMGGLGFVFAREIAKQVKSPSLILAGRSLPDAGNRSKLHELESLGARAEYRQADIADKKQVDTLIYGIYKDYGALNGIIHSAGVIQDNFIIKKTKEEFVNVIKPKSAGLVNLDSAASESDLDLFVLFSSIAGSLGNAGQADYSSGNAFMDSYASYRNNLVKSGLRKGVTLSVGWPLWKEGGMRPDA